MKRILQWALDRPALWMTGLAVLVAVAMVQFPRIRIDTDPENMLPVDAPVRVFHHETKKEFALYDFLVVGIVNSEHPQGVFNPDTLAHVYRIVGAIKNVEGVIPNEIVALSTKDNIEQAGVGAVTFDWLMPRPPDTQKEATHIFQQALDHPLFRGSVVSQDGQALAMFIPIERKDLSYEVAQDIRQIIEENPGDEEFFITGLPVAEDQFGVEMFKQMAISAPLAGLIIFLLMWMFFGSWRLVIAPMIVAVATVLLTMGLLIGMGFKVHIMSSMIPIFLMPIAVLDAVHILSEFFDKYQATGDRRKTIVAVVEELFSPMLFTSLTSAVGFLSLSFSPIPPVQVFGIFVAIGILVAWMLTLTIIPAFIMLLSSKAFVNFGRRSGEGERHGMIDRFLGSIRRLSCRRFRWVLTGTMIVMVLSIYGITRIQVNDNPVRWFTPGHPIRVADRVLNRHLAGTYEAYLVLQPAGDASTQELFKRPDMLRYVQGLQEHMQASPLVGKVVSLGDIVAKVYDELLGGDREYRRIPDSRAAVAQCLISFENSHKPDDLWHFTTPTYDKLNVWFQLKSGDNKDMARVVKEVSAYVKAHPPPVPLESRWAGLTYINVVWQDNMVMGMLKNFMGSYIIVLFMMLFLFRSPVKALISMVPLTVTILFIYSLLGYSGKYYDMPVAVLSALTLGLSIDFAIHFIQRADEIYAQAGSWTTTADRMFAGPGRAILRNALVVAIGFLPLLVAPLVPYRTVGFFMFTIMAVSCVATLLILPAMISAHPEWVFRGTDKGIGCHGSHCMLLALFVSLAVAYVVGGYGPWGWPPAVLVAVVCIVVFAAICFGVSKQKACMKKEDKR